MHIKRINPFDSIAGANLVSLLWLPAGDNTGQGRLLAESWAFNEWGRPAAAGKKI